MKNLIYVILPTLFLIGCGDKIQKAKTAAAFIELGRQTASSAFKLFEQEKTNECKQYDPEGSDLFKGCMLKTKEVMDFYRKLEPQIVQAQDVLKKAILAAESGINVDLIEPIQSAVCLLTKCMSWIPEKYTNKIKMFLSLVGKFACEEPKPPRISKIEQLNLARSALQALKSL